MSFPLRKLDILSSLPREKSLLCFPAHPAASERELALKRNNLFGLLGIKFLPFTVYPICEERQGNFERIAITGSVSLPLT